MINYEIKLIDMQAEKVIINLHGENLVLIQDETYESKSTGEQVICKIFASLDGDGYLYFAPVDDCL